jgi:hypothetical protein
MIETLPRVIFPWRSDAFFTDISTRGRQLVVQGGGYYTSARQMLHRGSSLSCPSPCHIADMASKIELIPQQREFRARGVEGEL